MAYIEKEPIIDFIAKRLNNPDKNKAFGYDAIEILTAIEFAPTADVVEVVRCKDCIHSEELAKHCELDRKHYRHCKLWRGEETKNVWHKYTKHHKDYSIVSVDGFCDNGERKEV